MNQGHITYAKLIRIIILAVVFLSLTSLLFLGFREDEHLGSAGQKIFFSIGLGSLLAGLATYLLAVQTDEATPTQKKRWFFPVISGLLGMFCMTLAYAYLGVWPLGESSVLTVDMHHQYAPLLAQLRDMIINGGSPFYTFEVGLGASFIPLFGYYLASPFNLLLVLFPKSMLNEGILVITLLKSAITAGLFALCVQYIFRRRDLSVVIVSIMYSMMMYLLAYSWNIMWLDCVMVLPLIVMAFERLMRTGKYLLYILSLAYALYSNYYIAFMVCLFMVLYFICYCIKQKHSVGTLARSFGRFTIGSLLAGGLVMFLIVPVYISLKDTSAAGGTLPEITNNFAVFDLLGRHLYNTTPTIRSGNLPNIYCGILSVITLPVFATTKTIGIRRRLAYLGLLAVFGLSLVINQIDLIWHGLHAPNDLPYRFSFLYCFVLLLIAYQTIINLDKIKPKQALGSLAGVAGLIVFIEKFGGDDYNFYTIYVSLLLAVVYAAVIGLVSLRKIEAKPAYILLLIAVVAEMVFNAGWSFTTIQANEYFTARAGYVANDITKAIDNAVKRTEEIGDRENGSEFYRIELLPRRTTVDTALFDYRGITAFASSSPQRLAKFMGYIGYAVNGVNSHLYKSFVPFTDSLLGIKYVMLDYSTSDSLSSDTYLEFIEKVDYNGTTYSIYRNKTALPLGYLVEPSIKDWVPSQYNAFASVDTLYSNLTGDYSELFTLASVDTGYNSEDIASLTGGVSFTIRPTSDNQEVVFEATITKSGQTFAFIDCRAAKNISLSTTTGNSWNVSAHEPYIVNTGYLSQGSVVTVNIRAEDVCSGNIYVGTLEQDVFENAVEQFAAHPLIVSSHSDTRITGTINAPKNGVVFTSIPFDEGWTVKVDGKKVETFAAANAMLAFDITPGGHEVELSFATKGLPLGLALSVSSLVLLILLLAFIRKFVEPDNPDDNEFAALSRLLLPQKAAVQDTCAQSEQQFIEDTFQLDLEDFNDTAGQNTQDGEAQGFDNSFDAGL